MKAAYLINYGGQDAIKTVQDAPKPEISDDEVLVAVIAAGVNPFDWKVRDGGYQAFVKLELPAILGSDFVGTVAEIGANVTNLSVGQAVYGMASGGGGHGSYAEFTPVNADHIFARPEGLSDVEASGLPLAAISAYQGLVDHSKLTSGQKILIHGGGGGIGSLAIQIAKNIGAYVATTVQRDDHDYVKGLGADLLIDYETEDFTKLISDYDVVFDTVGSQTNRKSYEVLKSGGILVSMVDAPDEELVKQADIVYIHQSTQPSIERLNSISELVSSGKLHVRIDRVFPLAQTAEALEYLKTQHVKGKVVITI